MIAFMKYRLVFFAISLLVLVPGAISLATKGFRPSIDFTGGALLELHVPTSDPSQLTTEKINEALAQAYTVDVVQISGDHQLLLKGKPMTNETKEIALSLMRDSLGEVQELRFETVGPTLGAELLQKMITAMLLVAGIITLYIWKQFSELKYGVCAILAMFHDTLVLLGSFSILGWTMGVEVDVLFVTALLTTLSFSVHDTIVVYDRIRELRKKHPRYPLVELIDTAVAETLGRSINNSVTIVIMLLALVLLGGESIRWFAVALLIGAVTGTYSSTFTAAPLLLLWEDIARKQKAAK